MAIWSTDLRHFLNDKGVLPHDLPAPATRLAHVLGEIVVFATKPYSKTQTIIPCADHFLKQQQCLGHITSFLDSTDMSVCWECSHCDSSGLIAGWQNTIWDFGEETNCSH